MNTAHLIRKFSAIAFAALFLLACPAISQADDIICPAVYPCDDSGELLAMFEGSTDACAKKFALQCKQVRADSRKQCAGLSDEYNKLQVRHQKALSSVGKLKKALRKVKSAK